MKQLFDRWFLPLEKRTRGTPWRRWVGTFIRRFSPGFGAWDWYIEKIGGLTRVEVLGRPMYLDLRDKSFARDLYETRVHEPAETELLNLILRPGMTFIDIGANIGYYTLLGAEAVGPNGQVIAFEPDPHNLHVLKKNLALNHCTNVVVEARAVSDRSGPLELFLSRELFGDHKSYRERGTGREARPSIPIESVSLDEYVEGRALRVDVIKMDIQGAEPAALRGMERTLAGNRDIILVMEFWPDGLADFGVAPEDFLREVARMGLYIYEISSAGGVEATTAESLLQEGSEMTGDEHTDLVLSRQELPPGLLRGPMGAP